MSERTGSFGSVTFRWLDRQSKGKVTACDKCHKRVWPEEPRLQVHDSNGSYENKGTYSSYWCKACAASRGIYPPVPENVGTQEGLFDG